jgi:hypothetical protein
LRDIIERRSFINKYVLNPPDLTNEKETEEWCRALQGNEVGIANDSEVVKQRSHDRAKKQ